jgi:glycosyltransferase involved in cell wall biosynthesis
MATNSLTEEYRKLNPSFKKLYVVPLLNHHIKNTDYLYLLYKDIINDKEIEFVNLSAGGHYKLAGKGIRDSVLHYHWFEVTDIKSLAGITWKLAWIIIYKAAGGKIIWTVHNKYPHAGSFLWLNKPLRKFMGLLADRLHVHCSAAIDIMQPVLKVKTRKFFVYPHPEYPALIEDKTRAYKKLCSIYSINNRDNDGNVFLVFGQIAQYKGIEGIVEAFLKTTNRYNLIIAGNVKKGSEEYFNKIKRKTAGEEKMTIIDQVIPDEDVPLFFNSADYAVFNFTDILTSGGVILALSYKKQVIIPATGCLKEAEGANVTKFLGQAELEKIIKELTGNDNAD